MAEDSNRSDGAGFNRSVAALAAALLLALAVPVLVLTPGAGAQTAAPEPTTGTAADYSLSPPVRDLPATRGHRASGDQAPPRINPLAGEADRFRGTRAQRGDARSGSPRGINSGRTPAPGLTFEGIGNPTACGGCVPPDTNGDVGPNHYIQMVNATKVAIYNKTGTLLTPIFDLGTLWPGTSPCNDNLGDPIVVYDEAADRWLLSQFYDDGSTTGLCFAISQTADPLGSYHLFQFVTPEFPDYFKVGVWPTGYYVSANEAPPATPYAAYAFDRTKMLAGDSSASFVRFAGETNFLLPADVDGPTLPSGGGLFYTFKDNTFHGGTDRIELFQLVPDFTTPANSTFTNINDFTVTAFTYTVCGFFDLSCVPQSGGEQVDAVSEWPMHRFAYRNFGSHQALVGNFTIGGGSASADTPPGPGAQIRWFELRNTGSGWSLFQEGTFDPGGGLNRFMGSIAIDKAGNIALGYSASSSAAFPSIRYATRAPGDPAGTLQAEQVLQAGGGSQTAGFNRWGDYSAMSVDPSDDCTFWYTNEYYPVSAASTWKTRIGNFIVPGCTGPVPAFSASPPSINFGNQSVATTSATQTVTVTNTGTAGLTISSVALATGNPGDFAIAGDTCSGQTIGPAATCAVGARFAPTATGARATALRFTDNAPGSPHDVALTGNGTSGGGGGGGGGGGTPSNDIEFGKVKRNTKKGTATLTVSVDAAGQIGLSGSGVKSVRPLARAARTKPVAAAGDVKLPIKPKGSKKRKLNNTGKVKVKVKVTFTPTGGTANTESKSVKLKRRLG